MDLNACNRIFKKIQNTFTFSTVSQNGQLFRKSEILFNDTRCILKVKLRMQT